MGAGSSGGQVISREDEKLGFHGPRATGHGNKYLARVLGDVATSAGRTRTVFLGARYRRLARCRGSGRATTAVSRSVLVIVWHLLKNPDARFIDLGPNHYDQHRNTDAVKRQHVRRLEALG